MSASDSHLIVQPHKRPMRGSHSVPGDKSISHRGIIFGSLAQGATHLYGFLQSEDCLHTRDCFEQMGVSSHLDDQGTLTIEGRGLHGLNEPQETLYVGNSGTAIRLLSGILAAQPFTSQIEGDSSIAQRPMKRVIEPLTQMGAIIESQNGLTPLLFHPSSLQGITYHSPIASAQVKSCLLLAGLYAAGTTTVYEPHPSRNHTELMLKQFGANIPTFKGEYVPSILAQNEFKARNFYIPGDISSAAFFIVAALITPGSQIKLKRVGINPTRRGIIDVLLQMGAHIDIQDKESSGEPMADLVVRHSKLKGIELKGDIIANIIDEIPILSIAAAHAEGSTHIREAKELRVKESDRIHSIVQMISQLGGQVIEYEDGLIIEGTSQLQGGKVNSFGDHRIAMSAAIAALNSHKAIIIQNTDCIATSFPSFWDLYAHFKEKEV